MVQRRDKDVTWEEMCIRKINGGSTGFSDAHSTADSENSEPTIWNIDPNPTLNHLEEVYHLSW